MGGFLSLLLLLFVSVDHSAFYLPLRLEETTSLPDDSDAWVVEASGWVGAAFKLSARVVMYLAVLISIGASAETEISGLGAGGSS